MTAALMAALEHKPFPALTSLDVDSKMSRPGQKGMRLVVAVVGGASSCCFSYYWGCSAAMLFRRYSSHHPSRRPPPSSHSSLHRWSSLLLLTETDILRRKFRTGAIRLPRLESLAVALVDGLNAAADLMSIAAGLKTTLR